MQAPRLTMDFASGVDQTLALHPAQEILDAFGHGRVQPVEHLGKLRVRTRLRSEKEPDPGHVAATLAHGHERVEHLRSHVGIEAEQVQRHQVVGVVLYELIDGKAQELGFAQAIAKRLGVPCAVISAPIHVQDFPARYSPQMGFEGANVLFDTWVHPLMMGLEEHLIGMFREDFEFHDGAAPSHLGHGHAKTSANEPIKAEEPVEVVSAAVVNGVPTMESVWEPEAQKELNKIPFFVRGKARRNTERFANERGLPTISLETLYDAKAHFGR